MNLEDFCVILASGSPRRIAMLKDDGLSPLIVKPDCSEDIHSDLAPHQLVTSLALRKGLSAEKKLLSDDAARGSVDFSKPYIIISADTVVCKDGVVFGKPRDRDDAKRMLVSIRGTSHQVCSGVFLRGSDGKGRGFKKLFYDVTDVFVKNFSDEWLEGYLDTDEPYDKAGAYAIQGLFGVSIDHIEGDYDNVVGLPYKKLKEVLSQMTF